MAFDNESRRLALSIPLRLLLGDERVHRNAAGQVVPKLKTPWRDCTKHLVMSPLELTMRFEANWRAGQASQLRAK